MSASLVAAISSGIDENQSWYIISSSFLRPISESGCASGAEATQAVILAAAEEEFAQHGFIAAKTGVAKSMIYYYFKDKEGLYKLVLERSHSDLWQTIQQLDLDH